VRDERDMRDEIDSADGDPLIGSVVRELRAPVRLDPALDARVMAEILGGAAHDAAPAPVAPVRVSAHPVRRGPWRWLLEPRTVRISPLFGLAMAAGVAAVMVVGSRQGGGAEIVNPSSAPAPANIHQATDTQHAPRTTQQPYVHFVFVAPNAKSVSVVGDFNDWKINETPLRPVQNTQGVWSVSVPLSPGRYTYTFVVDGETWVADPSAPPALEDDFGTPKSVVTVGGTQT
jgi:hypothetical protein